MDVCCVCIYMHKHAKLDACSPKKLFEIRLDARSANASDRHFSRSSMVSGVLHPIFGCPVSTHAFAMPADLEFYERRY